MCGSDLSADISVATGVAEGTIRNSYKDLYPHVSKILPGWYAKEEDLKNLCSPWNVEQSDETTTYDGNLIEIGITLFL